jgi:hypothetical protein
MASARPQFGHVAVLTAVMSNPQLGQSTVSFLLVGTLADGREQCVAAMIASGG